jgi:hypothetical protein
VVAAIRLEELGRYLNETFICHAIWLAFDFYANHLWEGSPGPGPVLGSGPTAGGNQHCCGGLQHPHRDSTKPFTGTQDPTVLFLKTNGVVDPRPQVGGQLASSGTDLSLGQGLVEVSDLAIERAAAHALQEMVNYRESLLFREFTVDKGGYLNLDS